MVHLILLAIVLVAFFGQKNKLAFPFAMTALGVFSALRYDFASDYQNYYIWYNEVHLPGAVLGPDEFLYNILNYVAPHYFWVIAVTSVIFLYGIYYLIRKHLPLQHQWLGLTVFLINPYLFLMNLSAIRQSIALILFIFAIDFAYKKKPVPYILLIVLAIFFHKSAVILFPFYFVANDRPFRRRTVLAVLAGVLALLFVVDLNNITNLVARWTRDSNYLYYATTSEQNSLRATLLTSLFFLYVLANLNKLEGKTLVYGKFYLIATVFGILAFRLSLFTRIQMYFDIFSVITLPAVFFEIQKRGRVKLNLQNPMATLWGCFNKYALPALLVIVYLLRYYSFFANPMWSAFDHYQTIFAA